MPMGRFVCRDIAVPVDGTTSRATSETVVASLTLDPASEPPSDAVVPAALEPAAAVPALPVPAAPVPGAVPAAPVALVPAAAVPAAPVAVVPAAPVAVVPAAPVFAGRSVSCMQPIPTPNAAANIASPKK